MNLRLAMVLAWRTLAPRGAGRSLAGAIVGMGMSLVPLVLVVVVSNGMIEGITQRLIEAGTYHMQVWLPREVGEERAEALAERLERLPSVRAAFVELDGLGLLYSRKARLGIQVRAVPPSLYEEDGRLRATLGIEAGGFTLGPKAVVLGEVVARDLGVSVGDEVGLLTARAVRGRWVPRVSRLRVTGLFASGYQELDRAWVYVSRSEGQQMLPPDSTRLIVGVKLHDLETLDEARGAAEAVVAELGLPARVAGWYELEENQYRSYQTTRALLVFIMALIVIVAAVNVSSAMVMIVLEKRAEIAILKSMGTAAETVAAAFVAAGLLAGAVGALLGVTLGLAVSVNVNALVRGLETAANGAVALVQTMAHAVGLAAEYRPLVLLNPAFYLESIPVRIGFGEAVAIAVLAVAASAAGAYVPARRAAAIRPIDVLRRE